MLERTLALLRDGGNVAWLLAVNGWALWSVIAWQALSRRAGRGVRPSPSVERRHRQRLLLNTLLQTAPLLGLLGTVSGMVETFEALQKSPPGFASESSVAGGISRVLITTQLGLVLAVPALLAARWLSRPPRPRADDRPPEDAAARGSAA